jgi:hypothetical protein
MLPDHFLITDLATSVYQDRLRAASRPRVTATQISHPRHERTQATMKRRPIYSLLFAIFTLLLAAVPTGAQAPESFLNLNAYQCPADYDQVSDCTKLGGVVVAVSQDGQPLGQVITSASEGATLDLMFGAFISLEVVGGVPEGTVLADTTLSFDAIEGQNAVTLIFLPEEDPAPSSYLSLYAWWCPADYEDLADACTRLADVYVDVSQDGQPLGQVVTQSTDAATLALQAGAFIELEIAGGVPEGAVLESELDLAFTAVAGENPAMLVFVDQEGGAPPPPHSDANALVVQALLCPVAYTGNNYAADCVGEPGIEATVTRDADGFTVTDATGADGIVGFQGLSEGTYTVELGVPGDFADFQTVCGTPDGFEPREVTNPNTNRIGVYLGPEEELTCTFFIIPVDANGAPTVTPAPTKPAGPVASLPDTGAGSPAGGSEALVLALAVALLASVVGLVMGMRRASRS